MAIAIFYGYACVLTLTKIRFDQIVITKYVAICKKDYESMLLLCVIYCYFR